jgi:hypothetical protein
MNGKTVSTPFDLAEWRKEDKHAALIRELVVVPLSYANLSQNCGPESIRYNPHSPDDALC